MWEAIGNIFTSKEFLGNIPGIILLIVAVCILGKLLKVRINTNHIQIGGEQRDAFYERAIVRNQIQEAHDFIMSLEQKVNALIEPERIEFGGWKTKCILELVFDKVVNWITFNHIELSDAYLSCKYHEIDNLIYQNCHFDEYKTHEFQERVHKWTKELIEQLIEIRHLYLKQAKEHK